jgi:hypothetical protein
MVMLHFLAILLMLLSAGQAKYYLVETAGVAKPNGVNSLGGAPAGKDYAMGDGNTKCFRLGRGIACP